MRTIFAVMAALGLAIIVNSLLTHPKSVSLIEDEHPRKSTPPKHHCMLGCSHRNEPRSATKDDPLKSDGLLWEKHWDKPADAPASMPLAGPGPAPDDYQQDSRQKITLEDGSQLLIDIEQRHIHTDGTIAINGSVAGSPRGRIHMQWNQQNGFFLGQIDYPDLPVAYEITRGSDGSHLITRRAITELVCAEIDPATGAVTYGLPPVTDAEAEGVAVVAPASAEAASLVPALNSHPTATACIYLDFDGEQVTGTSWGNKITAAATGYSASKITDIWNRVATDFEPFNLNVTTEESVYLNAPSAKRIRCIITPSNEWYGSSTAGGVAKYNSFVWSGDTPCWVFSDNLANGTKYIAEACSHETGHTFGLSHDGKSGTAYYAGHGSGAVGWAPIMGSGYFKNVTQWSKGEYSSATNTQDDLSIISSTTNGFGYRKDDHNNHAAGATPVPADSSNQVAHTGTIERKGDTDVFSVESGAGTLTLAINPASSSSNLDIQAELYDAAGSLVASANPETQLNASINASVSAGTYFLHVHATGYGSANTGFTDYASLGSYTISGEVAAANAPSPFERTVAALPETQRNPDDDPDNDGYSNLYEHALGTNPAAAEPVQHGSSIDPDTRSGIDFLIDLPTDIPSDVIYTVQATCTLDAADWTSIASRDSTGAWTVSANVSANVTEEAGPGGTRRFRVSENTSTPWACRFLRLHLALAP